MPRLLSLLLVLALWPLGAAAQKAEAPAPDAAASTPTDFSPAERLLLMSDQLAGLKPQTTLRYHFRKSGSLEPAFEDQVSVDLVSGTDGACCTAKGQFLSGERKVELPDIEHAQGNPVILYFLEHDIRDMHQRTKGSVTYFRKRIRLALFDGATLRDTRVDYKGRKLAAREIEIHPFKNDPNRARFEKFTSKRYVFTLSDELPGRVAAIRTLAVAPGTQTPMIEEELLLDGARPLASP